MFVWPNPNPDPIVREGPVQIFGGARLLLPCIPLVMTSRMNSSQCAVGDHAPRYLSGQSLPPKMKVDAVGSNSVKHSAAWGITAFHGNCFESHFLMFKLSSIILRRMQRETQSQHHLTCSYTLNNAYLGPSYNGYAYSRHYEL